MTWQRTSPQLETGEVVIGLIVLVRQVDPATFRRGVELAGHHFEKAGLDLMFFPPELEAKLRRTRRRRWWRPNENQEVPG